MLWHSLFFLIIIIILHVILMYILSSYYVTLWVLNCILDEFGILQLFHSTVLSPGINFENDTFTMTKSNNVFGEILYEFCYNKHI